jgi:hypothetical protein
VESSHKGGNYINTRMPQWYSSGSIEMALSLPRADNLVQDRGRVARFCLQAVHIERCFTESRHNKGADGALALKLYSILVRNGTWPSQGQMRAMTMAFEDLFRPSATRTDGKLCCLHRIADFKFQRSITPQNLRYAGNLPMGGVGIHQITANLARRAAYFH